jgi:hypothetical protein
MQDLQGLSQEQATIFEAHVQSVRFYLRDFEELNLLIRGEESSDRNIAWATLDFLSDFNGTPPFTSYSLEGMYARHWQHFAIRGTTISLMESLIHIYTRNYLPFSDNGISVEINSKAPMLQSMMGLMQSSYEQNKRLKKTAINVEALLDSGPSGVHSEYIVLSGLGYM